jgi:DNA-binding MarR family transcriptional regulator
MPAKAKKIGTAKTMKALTLWHGVTSAALEHLPYDLSSRQTAILLHVYLLPSPHSIKNLSKSLSISKAAICRAVDVLENAKLLRRASDRNDKRNILLLPTAKGSTFLQEFASLILSVSKETS